MNRTLILKFYFLYIPFPTEHIFCWTCFTTMWNSSIMRINKRITLVIRSGVGWLQKELIIKLKILFWYAHVHWEMNGIFWRSALLIPPGTKNSKNPKNNENLNLCLIGLQPKKKYFGWRGIDGRFSRLLIRCLGLRIDCCLLYALGWSHRPTRIYLFS